MADALRGVAEFDAWPVVDGTWALGRWLADWDPHAARRTATDTAANRSTPTTTPLMPRRLHRVRAGSRLRSRFPVGTIPRPRDSGRLL